MIKILLNGNGENNKEYKLIRIDNRKYLLLLNDENLGMFTLDECFDKIENDNEKVNFGNIIEGSREDEMSDKETLDYMEYLTKKAEYFRNKSLLNKQYGMRPDFLFGTHLKDLESNIPNIDIKGIGEERINRLKKLYSSIEGDKKSKDPLLSLLDSIIEKPNFNNLRGEDYDGEQKTDISDFLKKLDDGHDCNKCSAKDNCPLKELKEKSSFIIDSLSKNEDINNKQKKERKGPSMDCDFMECPECNVKNCPLKEKGIMLAKLNEEQNRNRDDKDEAYDKSVCVVYGGITRETMLDDINNFPNKPKAENRCKIESLCLFYDKLKPLYKENFNSEKSLDVLIYKLTEDYLEYFKKYNEKERVSEMVEKYFNNYSSLIEEQIKNY